MVGSVGHQKAVEHGLVDCQVVGLHVLEDGGGPGDVPLATEQSHAGLEGDAVSGNIELLQLGQELRHVNWMIVLTMNLDT